MGTWPWLLVGGGAAAAVYFWTRRDSKPSAAPDDANAESKPDLDPAPSGVAATTPPTRIELAGRWVWPVGVWRSRKPEISDGFGSPRPGPNGTKIRHGGVDVMYRRHPEDPYPTGTPHGSKHFVMPDRRAALAASDGVVTSASLTPRGWSVIINHAPRKYATYYTHLSSLQVALKQEVRAGQPIGIIGADPLDGAHLMHLHFELWQSGERIDPQPSMRTWPFLPDASGESPLLVARNANGRVPVREHSRGWPRHGR